MYHFFRLIMYIFIIKRHFIKLENNNTVNKPIKRTGNTTLHIRMYLLVDHLRATKGQTDMTKDKGACYGI